MNEPGNFGRSVTVALPDILERLRDRIHDSHMDAERLMDDAGDEIERLRAMPGWQPISTAPKDGTRIIAWPVWSDGLPAEVRWRNMKRISGRWETGIGTCGYEPTHWQPLPTPPEVQS